MRFIPDGAWFRFEGSSSELTRIHEHASFEVRTSRPGNGFSRRTEEVNSINPCDGDLIPPGYVAIHHKILPGHAHHAGLKKTGVRFAEGKVLRPHQVRAVFEAANAGCGQIIAPPGSGKTVMACGLINLTQLETLVLVHTKDLQEQWVRRVREFLDLEPNQVKDGRKYFHGAPVTVAMIQSLAKTTGPLDYPQVIQDECHHQAADSFMAVHRRIPTHRRYGITATPVRGDGMGPLIDWWTGPVAYHVSDEEADLVPPVFFPLVTDITWDGDLTATAGWQNFMEDLSTNHRRNRIIVDTIAGRVEILKRVGRSMGHHLVLTEKRDHAWLLGKLISQELGVDVGVAVGDLKQEHRNGNIRAATEGEIQVLVGTSELLGEGIDIPRLDHLWRVAPSKSWTKTIQGVGRVRRRFPGKERCYIIDVFDQDIPVCRRHYATRKKAYDAIGQTRLPGRAA